jgi:molecular chaperone DnaK (HSP70)
MTLNKKDYERACADKFKAIVELIKDLITKTNLSEKEIDDIVFIGNTTNVNIIKQKISKIFKNKNNQLFNKLANNKYFENDINITDYINEEYIAIGASLQCFNLYSNKLNNYKYIEITPISFGIEGLNKKMDFVIRKGSFIPEQVKKFVKISKPVGDCIGINVYEGEEDYVNNNRLISKADINIKNFRNEKKGKDYVEILIQFIINNNFDLSVFILDTKTLRKKLECIINIDIVHG